tara:strand:- start:20347 stop:20919 length:573 start_codon:yes stop_codon:yes gene_type:complete
MQRTAPWIDAVKAEPSKKPDENYHPLVGMVHSKELQITGNFDKMTIEGKNKIKTRGVGHPLLELVDAAPDQAHEIALPEEAARRYVVDKRAYKVFKTLFHVPADELGDVPRAVKWDEFKRAMARIGVAVEKLPGCAWKFTPTAAMDLDVQRGTQFNEPHPDDKILYNTARRFGRRLSRAYGWSGGSFELA